MKKYSFVFPLSRSPVPHQNHIKRAKWGGCYKDKELTYYQKELGYRAKQEMSNNNWEIITGEYQMIVEFYCVNKKRGDMANILKAFEDALEKIVYINDNNLVNLQAKIKYDKFEPRIECVIIF